MDGESAWADVAETLLKDPNEKDELTKTTTRKSIA
jgi:hypothetical protein